MSSVKSFCQMRWTISQPAGQTDGQANTLLHGLIRFIMHIIKNIFKKHHSCSWIIIMLTVLKFVPILWPLIPPSIIVFWSCFICQLTCFRSVSSPSYSPITRYVSPVLLARDLQQQPLVKISCMGSCTLSSLIWFHWRQLDLCALFGPTGLPHFVFSDKSY